jgi:hydroxycarboxylate dehydrogenase B
VKSRLSVASELEQFARAIFEAMGATSATAAEVAAHLVRANLSGHDSHGIQRVTQYAAQVERGDLVPSAKPVVAHESEAVALIDAHRSFGQSSTNLAVTWAMHRARRHGVSAAAIRHSAHVGRLGHYTEHAAQAGLVAILTVGAAGHGVGGVVPFGARQRFLATNPWSIGIPSSGSEPVVFDASTSTIAEGKVRVAQSKGAALPSGSLVDSEGKPSTDPNDYYAGGGLTPLGGDVAGHKGYGLGLMSALIGSLAMIDDSDPSLIGAWTIAPDADPVGRVAGVLVVIIDPAFFGPVGGYLSLVTQNMAAIKRLTPAPGVVEVLVPGELEAKTRERRLREGIAIPEATIRELTELAKQYGVPLPPTWYAG